VEKKFNNLAVWSNSMQDFKVNDWNDLHFRIKTKKTHLHIMVIKRKHLYYIYQFCHSHLYMTTWVCMCLLFGFTSHQHCTVEIIRRDSSIILGTNPYDPSAGWIVLPHGGNQTHMGESKSHDTKILSKQLYFNLLDNDYVWTEISYYF
jgi:hypothetical protein